MSADGKTCLGGRSRGFGKEDPPAELQLFLESYAEQLDNLGFQCFESGSKQWESIGCRAEHDGLWVAVKTASFRS